MITVALPLSASNIVADLSLASAFRACLSHFMMLDFGGLAWCRAAATCALSCSPFNTDNILHACSLAMM